MSDATPVPRFDDHWAQGEAYEGYMGRWSRRVAKLFVPWLGVRGGGRWLDVGCGTGALSSAVLELADPASVTGCDPSASFIEVARRRQQDPRLSFLMAGLGDLPAIEDGFDAVVSGLVLNFLPSPVEAIEAMIGRLGPGGLVGAYVWDYAGRMDLLRVFWEEARGLDPAAAELDEGPRFPICRPEALEELFHGAGLRRVRTAPIEVVTQFDGFTDFWKPFLRGTGPAPRYVASLPSAGREELARRLQQRLFPEAGPAAKLMARAWAVRGGVALEGLPPGAAGGGARKA